ncbi:MAG: ABC transporter permease subunit [Rhizobiales bacterium]|nr:ABC transporter permease subunit [Hyphomicrobiales bacterium]
MTISRLKRKATKGLLLLVLALTYVFLFLPLVHIGIAAFARNFTYPYPPLWTLETVANMFANNLYRTSLLNSFILGLGSAVIATVFSTIATFGLLRYAGRHVAKFVLLFMAPLFVAEVLLGISSSILGGFFLQIPGNLISAMLANSIHCFSFALLIMATQLYRYDWRLDEAAMVFGASPAQTFFEVTLPLIWPGLLSAFIISLILSFNNLEISFYLLGATPTLPSMAWGALRHGIKPELYALATVVNIVVFVILAVIFVLMKTGSVKFGYRPERESSIV